MVAIRRFAYSNVQLGISPDQAFVVNAASAGLILIVLTLSLNAIAIVIRYRVRKRIKW